MSVSDLRSIIGCLQQTNLVKMDPRVAVEVKLVTAAAQGGLRIRKYRAETAPIMNVTDGAILENWEENELVFPIPKDDVASMTGQSRVRVILEEWDKYSSADLLGGCEKPLLPFMDRRGPAKSAENLDRWQLTKKLVETMDDNNGRIITSTYYDESREGGALIVVVHKALVVQNPIEALGYRYAMMLLLTVLLVYIGIGVVAFTGFEEKWDIRESVYFASVTFTTVGYGDYNARNFSREGKLFVGIYGMLGLVVVSSAVGIAFSSISPGEERQTAEEKALKSNQKINVFVKIIKAFVSTVGMWLAVLALGVALFVICEEKEDGSKYSLVDSFYFTVITMTAVGFGEMSYKSEAGQWLGAIYIPLATLSTGVLCSKAGEVCFRLIGAKCALLNVNSMLGPELMDDKKNVLMDVDGCLGEEEFVRIMLLRLGKIDNASIELIDKRFHLMDDGDGALP